MNNPPHEQLPARLWWVLAGLALVWGCNWTAMKVAIAEVAPLTFRTLCLGAGSGILFAVLRLSGQPLTVRRDASGRASRCSPSSRSPAGTCW